MKLYLDGLLYKSAGIGRYYESLTKEFAKRGIKIYTCVPNTLRNDFEKDFSNIPNIEPIFVDFEKFSLKGFFTQSRILKQLKEEVDLFFTLFYPTSVLTGGILNPATGYLVYLSILFMVLSYIKDRRI